MRITPYILILIVPILVGIIGIAAFLFVNSPIHTTPEDTKMEETSMPKEGSRLKAPDETVKDITQLAIDKQDETICFQHTECLFQSTCLSNVAAIKRDVDICSITVRDCVNLELFLGDGKDISLEGITDFAKNMCMRGVELEKIKDISGKGDHEQCFQLEGTIGWFGKNALKKDICLMQVAVNTGESSLCNLIEKGELTDTLGFTLKENCFRFTEISSELSDEESTNNAENAFAQFYDFFPKGGSIQECVKEYLKEDFAPYYVGMYVNLELESAFNTCLNPATQESGVALSVRLLPELEPCFLDALKSNEEYERALNDPDYMLNEEQNQRMNTCPVIQELTEKVQALEIYINQ